MRAVRVLRRLAVLIVCAVIASSVVSLTSAAAAPDPSVSPGDAAPRTWTFGCTNPPASQSFTVPAGVHFLGVDAHGGHGGSRDADQGGQGGFAGEVTATIPVTPNETLQIAVGCAGQSKVAGWGFGTGGLGGESSPLGFDGAAGGGSSAVARLSGTDELAVLVGAGGGGGGGGSYSEGVITGCNICNQTAGGNGGAGGTPAQVGQVQRCAPNGAVCTSGPSGGCVDCSGGYYGGQGGNAVITGERGGGGGGGGAGFQGGGGGTGSQLFGSSGAGGGGGTSTADASATDVTYAVSGRPGDGQITLTAGDVQTTVVKCTGSGPQQLTVPPGVTQISIAAYGAQGVTPGTAQSGFDSGTGGLGAYAAGTFPVTPGEVLAVQAGCSGATDPSTSPYGAAGSGGDAEGGDAKDGGAGGAASSVLRLVGAPLLVAGGGGGGGGGGLFGSGGDGGATVGGEGPQAGQAGSAAGHGDGGCAGCAPTPNGTDASGSNSFEDAGGGGGGGGGYAGGGGGHGGHTGGGGGGGGGAGSSYLDASHIGDGYIYGGNQPGNGSVTISWTLGPVLPVAVTASAGPDVLADVPVTYTTTITPPSGAGSCDGCSVAYSYAIADGPSGQLGTAPVGADWTAVSAPTTLPPGAATVTAVFSGPDYQDVTATLEQHTAPFSITVRPSPVPFQAAFDVVATPVSGTALPTTITVTDATQAPMCTITDGSGCTGLRRPDSAAGTETWWATADGRFPFPVTFGEQTPTVTFTLSTTRVLAGEPFQVTAKVTPAGGAGTAPTGNVELVVDDDGYGQVPLDDTGAATFPHVVLTQGTHAMHVSYLGAPGRWEPATSATTTVDASNPDVSIAVTTSSNPATVNQPVTYTATVTVPADAPPCPDCTVEFTFGRQGQVTVPVGPDTGWKAVTEFTWKTAGSFDVYAYLNQPARGAQLTQSVVSGDTGGTPPPSVASAIADLLAAAKAGGPQLAHAVDELQQRYRAGAIDGACTLLTQITAEQHTSPLTAAQAELLTRRIAAVRTTLDCT